MFWGRLAAWLSGVPVICSALHSTGLPDHVEFSNRLLAPLTDAFIAVAEPHGRYLAEHEGCPARKIRVIPNGVDVERFHPRPAEPAIAGGIELGSDGAGGRHRGGAAAGEEPRDVPPRRGAGPSTAARRPISDCRRRAGAGETGIARAEPRRRGGGPISRHAIRRRRGSVADGRAAVDLAYGGQPDLPVGGDGQREAGGGHPRRLGDRDRSAGREAAIWSSPNDSQGMADRVLELLGDRRRAAEMGRAGREQVVAQWSVDRMVQGYERPDCRASMRAKARARRRNPKPKSRRRSSNRERNAVVAFVIRISSFGFAIPHLRMWSWRGSAIRVR